MNLGENFSLQVDLFNANDRSRISVACWTRPSRSSGDGLRETSPSPVLSLALRWFASRSSSIGKIDIRCEFYTRFIFKAAYHYLTYGLACFGAGRLQAERVASRGKRASLRENKQADAKRFQIATIYTLCYYYGMDKPQSSVMEAQAT